METPEGAENPVNFEVLNSVQVHKCKAGSISVSLTGITAKPFKDVFIGAEQPDEDLLPPTVSSRAVYLGPSKGWQHCRVYWAPEMETDVDVAGPALVESPETVYWIPPGWSYVSVPEGFIRIERR